MIYAFISDEAFANLASTENSVNSYQNIAANRLGMLDDNLLNYFIQHEIMSDPVGAPLATNRTTRLSVNQTGGMPVGRMSLHFDSDKLDPAVDFIDPFKINPDFDDDNVRDAKIKRRAALFNIIETIYMAHAGTNLESIPSSISEIEGILTSANSTKNSMYFGYVPGSLTLSPGTARASYRRSWTNTETKLVEEAETAEMEFYQHFSFSFEIDNGETTMIQQFKIWLDPGQDGTQTSGSFKTEYPFSTITQVVYPCKPEWIVDPTNYSSEMMAVIAAASYKDARLDAEVTKNDHSGISLFVSRYMHPTVPDNARMSFIIMYKGAAPTSAAMRVAVRNSLMAEKDANGNYVADEKTWKSRLPDLFIDGGFYLIPCYFQREAYPGNTVIERNIVNYRNLYEKARCVFPNMDPQTVFEKMEVLQIPAHRLYVLALPMPDNPADIQSIKTFHPSYQAVDSVGESYQYVVTQDKVWLKDKNYYVQERPEDAPIYSYTKIDTTGHIGESIPVGTVAYERLVVHVGYWNTMNVYTKEFAQLLSFCYTACLDPESVHVSKFTEESIDGREFYSFGCNFIEYHMITLRGGAGILDTTDVDCPHTENIH